MSARNISLAVAAAMLCAAAGCGTVDHSATFVKGYTPPAGTLIEVGTVVNETGEKFDDDVENTLARALSDELSKQDLLHIGEGANLVLVTRIVDYEKGSAWRRWLVPGWGESVLAIRCELKEGERVVGNAYARRSISYASPTKEVWRDVFSLLAEDVAKDLRAKIARQ